jgi:hypothetical protein
MAWEALWFGVRHSLRDRGAANVSEKNAIASGDYEAFMFDERREKMSFAGAAADHHVQVDLGTGFASLTVDRLFVPVGHNFDTYDLRVRDDDNDAMSSAAELYKVEPHSGTGQIDVALTAASTQRYIRVDWITDNFAPDIPELWLTKKLEPSQGAQPDWRDERFYNVQTWITPSGDRGDLQLGASQRVFELEFPRIDVAADIAMLDQLVDDVGTEQAFLFKPPFDDEDVLICKMARAPERTTIRNGDSRVRTYRFSIIEQLV